KKPGFAQTAVGSTSGPPRPGWAKMYGTTRLCPGSSGSPEACHSPQADSRYRSRPSSCICFRIASSWASARRRSGLARGSRMRSTRAGTSVASVGSPTQISLPGSWSRQRSLQTTGMASSTRRLYSPPVHESPAKPRGPRLRELGLRIGELEPGATDSIVDVAGVRVGHVTIWRDEAEPPEGRGVARTGVTAVVPGSLPLSAGVAVLNGAGELTGSHEIREWGLLETPVYLTSTMAVGRIYDGAIEVAVRGDPRVGVDDVVIPVVGECDDSHLSEARVVQVEAADAGRAGAPAAGWPVGGGEIGRGSRRGRGGV